MSKLPPLAQSETADVAGDAARFRAVLRQSAVGVAEIDASGRFHFANERFCEMTGYSEAELLQLRFQDITHPDDLPANLEKFEQLLRDGEPYAFEKRYVRKDGGELWVSINATRIDTGPGEMPRVLGVLLDISDRRRAESAVLSSEQSYRSLFNSIDAGFCVIEVLFDRDQRPIDYVFLETNAVFEKLTDLRNARGARMRELAPAHEQHWFDVYGQVALTGEPTRFELPARALKRWYSVYAFRIGDAASRRVGVLFEDITARRLAEQRRSFLAELGEKLVSLRDEAAIARVAVEALGRFLGVDRCFFVECIETENRVVKSERYVREGTSVIESELSLFDFGGMDWWRSCSAEGIAVDDVTTHPLTREKAAIYAQIGVRAYLVRPFKSDGPSTPLLIVSTASPRAWTTEEARLVEDVVARVWPIIERARTDRELVAAHAELERRVAERTATLQETLSELESYSYSISHDMRAPLRAMQTYASIVSTDWGHQLSDEGRDYLRRIMNAAERMDQLIRDVLVFSRVARSAMPMERIELGDFIAGIIETYPGLSVDAAEIDLVPPLGAVRANPAALTQCLSNLLGNAIKFVASGVKPRVRIWSEAVQAKRRLFVQDNGIGIPRDAQEKIFGMFYQIDPAKGGTGVGLAVVRKAVERMGGGVGVSSTPGEGSTFWLELEDAG